MEDIDCWGCSNLSVEKLEKQSDSFLDLLDDCVSRVFFIALKSFTQAEMELLCCMLYTDSVIESLDWRQ